MNIKSLKKANPIEEVIMECGYPLARQMDGTLKCTNEAGLIVEPKVGRYRWDGKDESGDVVAWLCNRFNWPISTALKFLQNRAGMPLGQRKHLAVIRQVAESVMAVELPPAPAEPKPGDAEISDLRVRKALELGWDFPKDGRGNGIEIYIEQSDHPSRIFQAMECLPKMFVAYSGSTEEDDECSLCLENLPVWCELGDAFVSVALDGYYRFSFDGDDDDHFRNGIFCWRCVDRIKRWRRACDLIFSWRMEQESVERETRKDADRKNLETENFQKDRGQELAEMFEKQREKVEK